MNKIIGLILVVVGMFCWIQFVGSEQWFVTTMEIMAGWENRFGKMSALAFFAGVYVFPIPLGLLLMHRRSGHYNRP